MSFEKPIAKFTRAAAADLSEKRHYACQINGSDQVALCSTAGQRVDGILQNEPGSADAATLMTEGISRAVLGGTVAINDPLTTTSSGTLVKATGGDHIVARARVAGVSTNTVAVHIQYEGVKPVVSFDLYVDLAVIADGDLMTAFTPGFAGTIEAVQLVVTDPVTTAAKASTLNLEIGTTDLTGGVLALTSANCTPLGKIVLGTAITADNTFGATDTISVEATSTTAFIEGQGSLNIRISID